MSKIVRYGGGFIALAVASAVIIQFVSPSESATDVGAGNSEGGRTVADQKLGTPEVPASRFISVNSSARENKKIKYVCADVSNSLTAYGDVSCSIDVQQKEVAIVVGAKFKGKRQKEFYIDAYLAGQMAAGRFDGDGWRISVMQGEIENGVLPDYVIANVADISSAVTAALRGNSLDRKKFIEVLYGSVLVCKDQIVKANQERLAPECSPYSP